MKKTAKFLGSPRFRALAMAWILPMVGILGLTGCDEAKAPDNPDPTPPVDSTAYFAFRDAASPPPPDYKGPRFHLSHDYPDQLPAGGEDMPWLKVDVDFNDRNPDWNTGPWNEYIQTIFDYVREGQDPNFTDEVGWNVDVNGSTRWFHVPWMAYDPKVGREYLHGFTSERIASMSDFDGDGTTDFPAGVGNLPLKGGKQTVDKFETWAVGMYNDYAAYSLGQIFPESGVPQTKVVNGRTIPKGLPFKTGSCVVKTLFTVADADDAPYLKNAPSWTVDRHEVKDGKYLCSRSPQPVQLVQMDVAVADPRSPTKWVFGTFVYDGTRPGESPWDRIVPLGIQFGNDPEVFPAVADKEAKPYQSVLNKNFSIYEHYGCNSRLAGPVDNKLASCMSCHGGAFTAPMDQLDEMGTNIPQIFYFATMCESFNDTNKAYFGNRTFPEPYAPGQFENAISTDYSLQVSVAFTQYKVFKLQGHPNTCKPSSAK